MPAPTSESRLVELTAEFDRWTRQQIELTGRFFINDALAHMGAFVGNSSGAINYVLLRQLMSRLGDCVSRGHRQGYARQAMGIRPTTLASLQALAEQSCDPNFAGTHGERTTRDLWKISKGMLVRIRAAVIIAAEMQTGAGARLEDVSGGAFAWDGTAGKAGRGDWKLVARVGAFYVDQAQCRHQRDNPGTPFDPRAVTEMRAKHEQGIRNLLDLGATHGLLKRDPEGAKVVVVHDAAWQPWIDAGFEMLGEGLNPNTARPMGRGLRLLALYATRRGWMSADETGWNQLRLAITEDFAEGAGSLKASAYYAARSAFNGLLGRGLISAERWSAQGDERISLVPKGVARRSATSGDFSEWKTVDGSRALGLSVGTFALTDWHRWATLPTTTAVAAAGLPPREFPRGSIEQQLKVAGKGHRAFRLRTTTMNSRLVEFNWHAGYCAARRGIDWGVSGADELCNPEHLRAHALQRDEDGGRQIGAPDSLVTQTAFSLATLASPYLEARALQQATRAGGLAVALRAAGKPDRAAQLDSRARTLEERAKTLALWSTELKIVALSRRRDGAGQTSEREGDEITRREVQALWLAWSSDGVSGWHKLGRLRDALIAAAEREAARCFLIKDANGRLVRRPNGEPIPLAEQIRLIEGEALLPPNERSWRPSRGWATLVRDALLVAQQILVPLRERNVVHMLMSNWRASGEVPWEGELWYEFSADDMKSQRPFKPLLRLADDAGDAVLCTMVRNDLMQLYFMEGGARDEVLRLHAGAEPVTLQVRGRDGRSHARQFGPGDVVPSRYVFPALARASGQHGNPTARLQEGCRWDEGSFAQRWRVLIRKHAASIGVNFEVVDALFGGAAPHGARHLFGTHHCWATKFSDALGIAQASKLLHHLNTSVTEAKYSGITERQISTAAAGRRTADAIAPPTVAGDRIQKDADGQPAEDPYTSREMQLLGEYETSDMGDVEFRRRLDKIRRARQLSSSAA